MNCFSVSRIRVLSRLRLHAWTLLYAAKPVQSSEVRTPNLVGTGSVLVTAKVSADAPIHVAAMGHS
jgi:hypothetical protein